MTTEHYFLVKAVHTDDGTTFTIDDETLAAFTDNRPVWDSETFSWATAEEVDAEDRDLKMRDELVRRLTRSTQTVRHLHAMITPEQHKEKE